MLGESGLGAGANPEVGKSEAQNTQEKIKKLLTDGTKMAFITAGMGGGTGTGAAPVIAGIAKSMGILTVGIVTIPFYFEKRDKIIKALRGVEEMRKNVDALLIVNNERLCDVYADSEISVPDAFKLADKVLSDATKSISELITVEGTINLDFRDVEATIKGGGGAIMAMGRANGAGRVQNAILNALDSPLLYGSDIRNAKRILFNIYTSSKHPIFVREMREIDAFFDELNPDIKVIWGLSDDDSLDEDAKVTILATGLNNELAAELPDNSLKNKEEEDYDEIISKLYHPIRDSIHKPSNVDDKKEQNEGNQEINSIEDGIDSNENTSLENGNEEQDLPKETSSDSGMTSLENPQNVPPQEETPIPQAKPDEPESYTNSPHRHLTFKERVKRRLLQLAEDFEIVSPDE